MASQTDNILLSDDGTGLARTIDVATDTLFLSTDLSLQSGGLFVADNIKRGTTDPNVATLAGNEGDLYQRTLTTTGELWVNARGTTTSWELVAADILFSKSVTVELPTATEDISLFFTTKAITISEMRAVVRGTTPSVTWTIRHGTDRSATGAEVVTGGTVTTSQTTGSDVVSFNDATIVADSFVWLETTAQTGTVAEIAITVVFTDD